VIVLFSVYSLARRHTHHLDHDSRAWLLLCGFLSGVMGGAYGLNGPPLVVYGNLRRWSASHFRATLQAYFLVASLIVTIGYAAKGMLDARLWRYFQCCIPTVVPAIFLGRHLNMKLGNGSFFRYVYILLAAVGVVLIVQTIAGLTA
jgi:uncharacterized membrane protein YfcA